MSDEDVLGLIEDLERSLERGDEILEQGFITDWQRRFTTMIDAAERGRDWPEVLQRAQVLAERLDERTAFMRLQRDVLRTQLEAQAVGRRALKGYRTARG